MHRFDSYWTCKRGLAFDGFNSEYRKATGMVLQEPDEEATDLHSFIPAVTALPSALVDGFDWPPFEHVSVNAGLMGWVIERVSGRRFAQVVSELICQPVGAESDVYITVDHGGNARTAAGMCATVRDVARLGNMILQRGKGIVPETWIYDTLSNESRDAFAAGSEKSAFNKIFDIPTYRSYWYIDNANLTLLTSGIYGQLLVFDCNNTLVMARTSSQPSRTD